MTTSATVTQYYNNVLQRDPTASELSSAVAVIDSGALTSDQVLDSIIQSTEGQTYAAQVIRFYQAAFNRVPDVTGINGWVDDILAGTTTTTTLAVGFVLSPEWTARFGTSDVNAASIQALYQNVLGRTGSGAEIDAWLATGQSMDQILIGFANSQEFQNNVTASVNTLLTTAGNTATADIATVYDGVTPLGTGGVGGGQNYTLTTGTDNITGTSSDDTIDGSAAIDGGVQFNTINNADSINGGAGTDSLTVQLRASATPTSFSNVETLTIETQVAASALNLINGDASIATVNFNNSAVSATLNNLMGAASAINITNPTAGVAHTVNVGAGLTGTMDALALGISNYTGAGAITIQTTAAGSGYETVNLASNGSVANSVTLTDGISTSLATLNVSGAQALTLGVLDTTVTTLDASTMTGALTGTVAAGSGAQTITGGTGNDVINMGGTYTSADTVNGGDGTDRMTLTNAEAIAATTAQTAVTNVEVIGLSNSLNGAVSVANFNATGLRFGANMAGASTVAYAAGTNSLDLQTFNNATNLLTTNTAGTATTDVLDVTIGSTAAGNNFSTGNVVLNGTETVNITSQGGANTFGGAFTVTDTAATQLINVTGSQNLTFTGAVTADTIDASAFTGILALNGGTGATPTAITGGTGADIIIGSTAGDILIGGAGNDTITNAITGTAASAGDQVTTGAGNDTVILHGDTASGTVATISGTTTFIDDFTVGATATATDIISVSATEANYANADALIAGQGVQAAGTTQVQTLAQNDGATALIAGTDFIKLTVETATAGVTLQQAFNSAIGTSTFTGVVAGDDYFFTLYDTTNARMLVGVVDATATTNTIVESGDTVSLIGTVAMSSTDYAAFNQNNFAVSA